MGRVYCQKMNMHPLMHPLYYSGPMEARRWRDASRKRDISLFVDLPVYLYVIKAESREILISSPDCIYWPSDCVCGMRCPNKGLYGPTTTSPRLRLTTAQNQRQSFPSLLLFLTNPSLGRSEGFLYACSWVLITGSFFTCWCQCSPACIHPRSSECGWK